MKTKTIVLVGKTGTGKSATANTLCGQGLFISAMSSDSVTKEFQKESFTYIDDEICVIDSPGVFDCSNDRLMLRTTFEKLLEHEISIDVFLHIYSLENRFTNQDIDTQKLFDSTLGERWTKYGIVVFTHADRFKSDVETLDYIKTFPNLFNIVQDRFGGRCLFLNNTRKDYAYRNNILEFIKDFIDTNNMTYTKNDLPKPSISHNSDINDEEFRTEVMKVEEEFRKAIENKRKENKEQLRVLKANLDNKNAQILLENYDYVLTKFKQVSESWSPKSSLPDRVPSLTDLPTEPKGKTKFYETYREHHDYLQEHLGKYLNTVRNEASCIEVLNRLWNIKKKYKISTKDEVDRGQKNEHRKYIKVLDEIDKHLSKEQAKSQIERLEELQIEVKQQTTLKEESQKALAEMREKMKHLQENEQDYRETIERYDAMMRIPTNRVKHKIKELQTELKKKELECEELKKRNSELQG